MKRIGFRGRLFLILLAFAVVPTILISLAWSTTGTIVLPLFGATAAWDSVAATGERALDVARAKPLAPPERQLIDAHEANLREGVTMSRRADFVTRELSRRMALGTLIAVLLIGFVGSRVAGHLSRHLSRPLQELVGWTERIGRGEPLPTTPVTRSQPRLVVKDDGNIASVSCGLCEAACPAYAITIDGGETDRPIEREPLRFDIDMLRCILCGFCEEACPKDAIFMSDELELADFSRAAHKYDIEKLKRPRAALQRRIDYVYRINNRWKSSSSTS